MIEPNYLPFILIGGGIIFVVLFFHYVPFFLWLSAKVSGVRISLVQLFLMRIRNVPPYVIVPAMIEAHKAGLSNITRDELEAHYMAGGHVEKVVHALVSASKANIELSFQMAAEEHQRHQIRHPLHAGHVVAAGLILHVDAGIDDIDNCHQQTEEADFIAVEWYRERQGEDDVGSREVFGPQERLAAKLDGRGEEREHGDEHRHLQQQRQTAREWARAGTAVERHCLLLALHGVFLTGIFVVDFLDFGSENPHLGLRLEALEGEGE